MPVPSRIYYNDQDTDITLLNARVDAFKETYPAPDYKIITENRYVDNLNKRDSQIIYYINLVMELNTIIPIADPKNVTATPNPVIYSQFTILDASVPEGCTINWYDAESGGNLLGNSIPGDGFQTNQLTVDTTFWAESYKASTGQKSANRVSVAVTIIQLLLDLYPGAAAAYSLRKLSNAYSGSCIRVRKSSDNTESDIGFVNNYLDTASLLSFCGSDNGFIKKWYDQSGSANNGIQETAAKQPQIVASGVLKIQEGLATLDFLGSRYFDLTSTISALGSSSWSAFIVAIRPDNSKFGMMFSNSGPGPFTLMINNDANKTRIGNRSVYKVKDANPTTRQLISSFNVPYGNNGVLSAYLNGVTVALGADVPFSRTTDFKILGLFNTNYFKGNCQEAIIYQLNKTDDRPDIEVDINTYYTIF